MQPLSIERSAVWKWWVCGLLLLATMLNYMDRLTLNLLAPEIIRTFSLSYTEYGLLESAFAIAFALGALTLGWLADRYSVYMLYPVVVLAWSVAGFMTGFAGSYLVLMLCRFALGIAEAGHWPCGLRTTQRLLPREQRTLGNSILQSGAALGAIFTPPIVYTLYQQTGDWRMPFYWIGALGIFWVVLWLVSVRRQDLPAPGDATFLPAVPTDSAADASAGSPSSREIQSSRADVRRTDQGGQPGSEDIQPAQLGGSHQPARGPINFEPAPAGDLAIAATESIWDIVRSPRFWVLVVVVIAINGTWHFFRAWLPLYLDKFREYSKEEVRDLTTAYYIAADLGSLAVGFGTMLLGRSGVAVHASRMLLFVGCAVLTALALLISELPNGPWLIAVFLLIGFGALGLFPNYYSFTQELTTRHQGKVTGMLGCINWIGMALMQVLVGMSIDRTQSYVLGLTLAGIAPLVAVAALLLFWGKDKPRSA